MYLSPTFLPDSPYLGLTLPLPAPGASCPGLRWQSVMLVSMEALPGSPTLATQATAASVPSSACCAPLASLYPLSLSPGSVLSPDLTEPDDAQIDGVIGCLG